MTASAGRQPTENKSASTESRRVQAIRAVGCRLWVVNPLARKNSDAAERLIVAPARIRGEDPGSTARAVAPMTGLL
jgi:hypothetical protein